MTECCDERKLLSDLRSGRREQFERLLDLYQDKVYSLACRAVGKEDAEDAAQDALVEICRSVRTFRGDSSLATWVYRVAINVYLQQRRKHHAKTVSLEEVSLEQQAGTESNPSEAAVRNETAADVDKAVARLPEIYRDAAWCSTKCTG